MSKYKGRVNRLVVKTHEYISSNNLELLHKYFLQVFKEKNINPNDYDKKVTEYHQMLLKYMKTKDEKIMAEVDEIKIKQPLLPDLSFYSQLLWRMENNPDGVWLPKVVADLFKHQLTNANDYFKKASNNT